MKCACPLCDNTSTRVYDHDREHAETGVLVRKRECSTCGARWATREVFVRLIRDATDAQGTGESLYKTRPRRARIGA